MRTFEGHVVGGDIRIGIVAARFNEFIVGKLVAGALDGLKRHEVDEDQIDIAWVPGAFEIRCCDPRQHDPLRLCLQRSFQGHRQCGP